MKTFGNVFIFGDSYSTYEGYIPEGFESFYSDSKPERLSSYKQTWWAQVIDKTNSKLVLNNSYSGTTVCSVDHWERYGVETSFISRMDKLIEEGFFDMKRIDTFFVFGGTNDSIAETKLGSFKTKDFSESDFEESITSLCYLFSKIKELYPQAEIITVLNCGIREDVINGFISAAEKFGSKTVALKGIDKDETAHPTPLGMTQIAEQILEKTAF